MKPETPDTKRQDTARRTLALAALIAGMSRPAAASAAGVSERTLDRWKAEGGFKSELEAGRRAAFSDALGGLRGAAANAVETLAGLLSSRHEAERRHAAAAILGFALKSHELTELEERIEALEKRASEFSLRPGARIS